MLASRDPVKPGDLASRRVAGQVPGAAGGVAWAGVAWRTVASGVCTPGGDSLRTARHSHAALTWAECQHKGRMPSQYGSTWDRVTGGQPSDKGMADASASPPRRTSQGRIVSLTPRARRAMTSQIRAQTGSASQMRMHRFARNWAAIPVLDRAPNGGMAGTEPLARRWRFNERVRHTRECREQHVHLVLEAVLQ